ncbi:MAG: hypothetical protein ACRBB0_25470 [Pelagimonas sp.]|uniref:hypothetical protein n=1 Tax=Pelagimonas sp. TaxID=2073170 RepID=UPI003D6A9A3E
MDIQSQMLSELALELSPMQAHEFINIARNENGMPSLNIETGTLAETELEDFLLIFESRSGWKQAWRFARINLSYGFHVLPQEAFL